MTVARIAALDAARGVAIGAMVAYHFSWDLSWFGLVDWPVAHAFGWRAFAGLIAGTFLFLSGFNLVLAHGSTIRWPSLLRGKAILLAAAAGISLVTYLVFGDSYVRFGILHALFLSGLLALPFLQTHWLVSLAAAGFVLTLPFWASGPAFNGQFWLWTGLGSPEFGSVDYVPLAPWAGVVLLGVALAQSPVAARILARARTLDLQGTFGKGLRLFGRRSLAIYLIHQPILFGLLWLASAAGIIADRAELQFVRGCTQSCAATEGAETPCAGICACTLSGLKEDGVWEPLLADPEDGALRGAMNDRYVLCLADPDLMTRR